MYMSKTEKQLLDKQCCVPLAAISFARDTEIETGINWLCFVVETDEVGLCNVVTELT